MQKHQIEVHHISSNSGLKDYFMTIMDLIHEHEGECKIDPLEY